MEIGIAIGLDAVSFMLSLLLVTMGLVIIFGLMNVINMAHGEFFLIGAYIVVTMQQVGQSFWLALIIAPMVLAVIGIIVEELVIRHVYHRFIDTILATWGISLILKQAVIIIFGPTSQSVVNPIPGTVNLVGVTYPAYRLAIMGISVLLATGTLLFIYRTNIRPCCSWCHCQPDDDKLVRHQYEADGQGYLCLWGGLGRVCRRCHGAPS